MQLFLPLMGGEAGFYLCGKPQTPCPFVSQSLPLALHRAHLSCSPGCGFSKQLVSFPAALGQRAPASLREGLVAVLGSAALT